MYARNECKKVITLNAVARISSVQMILVLIWSWQKCARCQSLSPATASVSTCPIMLAPSSEKLPPKPNFKNQNPNSSQTVPKLPSQRARGNHQWNGNNNTFFCRNRSGIALARCRFRGSTCICFPPMALFGCARNLARTLPEKIISHA